MLTLLLVYAVLLVAWSVAPRLLASGRAASQHDEAASEAPRRSPRRAGAAQPPLLPPSVVEPASTTVNNVPRRPRRAREASA